MHFLVQVDFPFDGPFGDEMTAAMTDLANDIANEEGLLWKIWTENAAERTAGGIYLFNNAADANRYLIKHTERLTTFGIQNIRGEISRCMALLQP